MIIQPEHTAVLAADQALCSISCFYLDVDVVGRSRRTRCVGSPGGFDVVASVEEARAGMSIQDSGQID